MLNAKRHWENINLLSRDAGYYLTTAPTVCVEALVLIAQAIAKSHGADREFKILKKTLPHYMGDYYVWDGQCWAALRWPISVLVWLDKVGAGVGLVLPGCKCQQIGCK